VKHKTAELEAQLLDYFVAIADGFELKPVPYTEQSWTIWKGGFTKGEIIPDAADSNDWIYSPSQKWEHGGPIIEREGIELHCIDRNGNRLGQWMARHPARPLPLQFAATPLTAAMRAFVASKLDEEVELP
jgi:hypothetical protein